DVAVVVSQELGFTHGRTGDALLQAVADIHSVHRRQSAGRTRCVPARDRREEMVGIIVDPGQKLCRTILGGGAPDVGTGLHPVHAIAVQHGWAATVGLDAVQLARCQWHIPATVVLRFGIHHVLWRHPPEIQHVVAFTRLDIDALVGHQIHQRQHRLPVRQHRRRGDVRTVGRDLHHLVACMPREIRERHRIRHCNGGESAQQNSHYATQHKLHVASPVAQSPLQLTTQNQRRFSPAPLPSSAWTFSTQRPQSSGCSACLPTSSRWCQQRTHLGASLTAADTHTLAPSSSVSTASVGASPTSRRRSDTMKKKRSSSATCLYRSTTVGSACSVSVASSDEPILPSLRIASNTRPAVSRIASKSLHQRRWSGLFWVSRRPWYQVSYSTDASRAVKPPRISVGMCICRGIACQISSAVNANSGASHRTIASRMRNIADWALRRPWLNAGMVYSRSLVMSRYSAPISLVQKFCTRCTTSGKS